MGDYFIWDEEVAGSSPVYSTKYQGVYQWEITGVGINL